ncbi:23S rRNA (uracil(1939)-C(5))-methyltransferase RlmD [Vibrio sp. SCSIO 43136]|uniref:23S rRNA (uracil(1939)-C(5))-methyltransferase RlmD n=1 Tax=Vibrio sp. SCSIO 43136 TaxID=2819101 RepID=UPI0020754FC4|nr:23S rRNA (uracil(1939)-C(5))-methyltransferase RlmD [Vibrio sp. SCSIO 43136]USD65664.1 23S rRNA (uracil(1939)-C(5))-methyltransferase RlmD [Vibrio sp. SCSIO 43136]
MARIYKPSKKKQIDTKHQAVMVNKLDHHGAGIAHLNNKPVFIEGALPGEEVLVQLTEQKSKFAKANLIKVLKPSDERIKPVCRHYHSCGGCNMQHLEESAQLSYKQKSLSDLMRKFAGETLTLSEPIVSKTTGYRRRTRIALLWDKKTKQLMFGFRRKASKQIINIDSCSVLASELNELLVPLHELLKGFANPEKFGHLELVKADSGRVVLLRHAGDLKAKDRQALIDYGQENQLTVYLVPEAGKLELLCGEVPYYQEVGTKQQFTPNNFIQVNQTVNQQMVSQALAWLDVQPQEKVLDLFCGIGNFSLPLAKLAQSVVGIEGVDAMVERATANAKLNQLSNCQFHQANLEEPLIEASWAKSQFDKILLDPARAGAQGVIEQLGEFNPKAIVYVSCNPATLARDSQSLLNQGYRLERLGMLDMFPQTSHLESMALFVK